MSVLRPGSLEHPGVAGEGTCPERGLEESDDELPRTGVGCP